MIKWINKKGEGSCLNLMKKYWMYFQAVVVTGAKEVWTYFDEEGVDISEMNEADILDADEVFAIGDGRFLIVEA